MKKNETKSEDKVENKKISQEELQSALQEKYMEYQVLEQQVKQVEEQNQTLQKQIEDLNSIKEAIESMEKTKIGSELFVPISAGIFVKAEIKENTELLVNVGDNVVVPKTTKDAEALVKKQHDEIKKYQERVKQNFEI